MVRVLVHALVVVLMVVLTLVSATRVGIVVNPRVPSQLVRARKLLAASGVLACMGLLASMSTNVASLVLETMEGLITERTLVGTRQLVRGLAWLGAWNRPIGLNDTDGCGSHIADFLTVLVGGRGRGWVEQAGQTVGLRRLHVFFVEPQDVLVGVPQRGCQERCVVGGVVFVPLFKRQTGECEI